MIVQFPKYCGTCAQYALCMSQAIQKLAGTTVKEAEAALENAKRDLACERYIRGDPVRIMLEEKHDGP